MTNVETDLDLDLDADGAEEVVEPTFEQKLSRMNRAQLLAEIKARPGLSGQGSNPDLIARIAAYEDSGGVIPERDFSSADLKPGTAPAPPEPTTIPTSAAGEVNSASAPAADSPTSVAAPLRKKQKTGFFEAINTYREEFPVGPRGTIDDATHFQYIADTHAAAARAGYITKGAPQAGVRIGKSAMDMPDGSKLASVIYEVFARRREE